MGTLRSRSIFASFLCTAASFALCCALAQPAPPLTAAPAPTPSSKADLDALPSGPGKPLVQKFCVSCHNIKIVTGKRGTDDDWGKTIDKMISAHGVPLSDADADTIVDYLSANYGPPSPKPAGDATAGVDKHQ